MPVFAHIKAMAYSIKGAISFGLIYIPVSLTPIIKRNDISFNMIDKNTKTRVKYIKTSDETSDTKSLKNDDIVKGYEYEDDKYVVFTDEDFEKIKSKKDKNITIEQFVNASEIDPIYYEKAYYVVPSGAEKAYELLLKAMDEEEKVGIARTVFKSKESLIAIRAKNGQMILNSLFFHEEVQPNPLNLKNVEISPKELDMAKALIEGMTEKFNIQLYEDEYRKKILKAIDDKIAGKEIVAPKENENYNKVTDLMQALEMSLKTTQKSKTQVKAAPKKKTKAN